MLLKYSHTILSAVLSAGGIAYGWWHGTATVWLVVGLALAVFVFWLVESRTLRIG